MFLLRATPQRQRGRCFRAQNENPPNFRYKVRFGLARLLSPRSPTSRSLEESAPARSVELEGAPSCLAPISGRCQLSTIGARGETCGILQTFRK